MPSPSKKEPLSNPTFTLIDLKKKIMIIIILKIIILTQKKLIVKLINPLASPCAGAPVLKYGYINAVTLSPGEVKGLNSSLDQSLTLI